MDALPQTSSRRPSRSPNRPLLTKVLRTVGEDRCRALLAETLPCEADGGMLTKDGTRRRTPGGTFFQLVKEHTTPQDRRRLFPPPVAQKKQAQPQTLKTWDEVSAVVAILQAQPAGEARTMKLTLIGRPGKVEARGQAVMFRMQSKPPGALPRGLPPLPTTPSITWNVVVALRQWNRVQDSLMVNTDDQLIIEGYPLMQGTQPVLMAQSCVSMRQQRAQQHQAEPMP